MAACEPREDFMARHVYERFRKAQVNRWTQAREERKCAQEKENAAVNLSFSFRTPSISCLSAAKAKWNNY